MSKIILGKHQLEIPLIQGGMGVGISLANLSGTVASYGGMGVISGVNPGYRDPNFHKDPMAANMKALKEEIYKAKQIAKGKGIIAVNLMYAINNYEEYAKAAVEFGADAIVSGAGLPLKLPEYVNDDVLIAPIVSSKRALELVIKTWIKRYDRICDFIVVEGPLAGGHLGFKNEDIDRQNLEDILVDVVEYVRELEAKYDKKIYIFAAGGIRNSDDAKKFMSLGADGIQLGTAFIATEECDADIDFKKQIVESNEEDLKVILSPAGFPARAINNNFLKSVQAEKKPVSICHKCLKSCDPKTRKYCIAEYLSESANGREGLVFSGARISSIDKITDVRSVIKNFLEAK